MRGKILATGSSGKKLKETSKCASSAPRLASSEVSIGIIRRTREYCLPIPKVLLLVLMNSFLIER